MGVPQSSHSSETSSNAFTRFIWLFAVYITGSSSIVDVAVESPAIRYFTLFWTLRLNETVTKVVVLLAHMGKISLPSTPNNITDDQPLLLTLTAPSQQFRSDWRALARSHGASRQTGRYGAGADCLGTGGCRLGLVWSCPATQTDRQHPPIGSQ